MIELPATADTTACSVVGASPTRMWSEAPMPVASATVIVVAPTEATAVSFVASCWSGTASTGMTVQ